MVHLAPGVACVLVIIVLVVLNVISATNMRGWLTDSFLDSGDKDTITGQTNFYIKPYCFNLWLGLMSGVAVFVCGKFAIKRLIYDWKPAEKKMKEKT
jgi:hypothetical protein